MPRASHKPRERYTTPNRAVPAVENRNSIAAGSSRSRMHKALCGAWGVPYPLPDNSTFGNNLTQHALRHDDETCDLFEWALDNEPKTATHAVNLISDGCGSMQLRVFIKRSSGLPSAAQEVLYQITSMFVTARQSSTNLTAEDLETFSALFVQYGELTGQSWEESIKCIPGLTISEELCLRLVHVRPDLSTTIAERLSAGEIPERLIPGIDEEMLEMLANNPAPALLEGTL